MTWILDVSRGADPLEEYEPEAALLTKVIEDRSVKAFVKHRWLNAKTFTEDVNRNVFEYIRDEYEENGVVPSLTLVRRKFPEFKAEETADPTKLVVRALKEKRLYMDLQQAVKRVGVEARIDAVEALGAFQEEAATLGLTYVEGVAEDITKSGSAILRQYRRMKMKRGLLGTPWPWARLNKATGGIVNGTFSAFYGPPGTMKTWVLIEIANNAHQTGGRPVFFTYEMPIEDIRFRWACLRAQVDYGKVRAGELSRVQEKRFLRAVAAFEKDPPFIVEELESTGQQALVEIRSKMREHGGTLGLIDGLGFLVEDAEWGSFWMITKGLKTLTRTDRVAIVATHHTNRSRKAAKKGDTDALDVALGDTLQRDCDVLVRVWMTPQNVDEEEVGLSTVKVREGKRCSILINARPAYDFTQKRVEEEDEATTLDTEKKAKDDDGIV